MATEAAGVTGRAAEDPAGAAGERALDEIFLSPRVVDQRAFEELATGLKVLVREARAQGKSLGDAAVEVSRLDETLREAAKGLHERVEAAVGAGPLIEQKLERARGMLEAAQRGLDERLREVKGIVGEDFGIDRERVAARVRSEVAGAVGALVEQQLRGAREEIARLTAEGAASLRREREAVEGLVRRARQELDGLAREHEARLAERAAAAGTEALDAVRACVAGVRGQLDDLAGSAAARVREAHEAAVESLRVAAASARETGERAAQEVTGIAASASARIMPLVQRAEEVSLAHAAAKETYAELSRAVTKDLAELKRRVEEATAAARSATGAPLTPAALKRAEQVGTRLTALVEQADALGAGLSRLLREVGKGPPGTGA